MSENSLPKDGKVKERNIPKSNTQSQSKSSMQAGNCRQPNVNDCQKTTDIRNGFKYQKNNGRKSKINQPFMNPQKESVASENIWNTFNNSGN